MSMASSCGLGREPNFKASSRDLESEESMETEDDASVDGHASDSEALFVSIWSQPFHMGKLPQAMSLELFKRAPFLLGSDRARYPAIFFQQTGGLCNEGMPFRKLADDNLFPLEDLVGTYPVSKKGNRHPLKLIADKATARDALHMYQRVYGGTHPDNGEFGTSFIRGLALFYQKNVHIRWADKAASLAKARASCPGKNPMKLTPPCLREQIQAMLNVFAQYLDDVVHCNRVVSAQPHSDLNPVPLPMRTPSPIQQAAHVNLSNRKRSPPRMTSPPAVKRALDVRSPAAPQRYVSEMQDLTQKHRDLNTHIAGWQLLEGNLEKAVADGLLECQKFAEAEDRLWDEQTELRKQAKLVGDNFAERARLFAAVRAKTEEASNASASLEAAEAAVNNSKATTFSIKQNLKDAKAQSLELSKTIGNLIVQNSTVRPQSYMELLPSTSTNIGSLQISQSCASCRKFFVDKAFAPLSCGCLFHPHCMFKTALSTPPCCPRCTALPSGAWMEQWGFTTTSGAMRAQVNATKVGSTALEAELPSAKQAATKISTVVGATTTYPAT